MGNLIVAVILGVIGFMGGTAFTESFGVGATVGILLFLAVFGVGAFGIEATVFYWPPPPVVASE